MYEGPGLRFIDFKSFPFKIGFNPSIGSELSGNVLFHLFRSGFGHKKHKCLIREVAERPERLGWFDVLVEGPQKTGTLLDHPQHGLGLTPGKRQPGQDFFNGRLGERIHQGHAVDDPWRREAIEREPCMPFDGFFGGFQ